MNVVRKDIGAPGMVVLQFAWGSGATNTHIPHNHYENSVCYPGIAICLCDMSMQYVRMKPVQTSLPSTCSACSNIAKLAFQGSYKANEIVSVQCDDFYLDVSSVGTLDQKLLVHIPQYRCRRSMDV